METGAKVFIAIIITAAIAGGGVWCYQNQKAQKDQDDLNKQISDLKRVISSSESVKSPYDTSKWKTYTSPSLDFSFKYPDDWTVTVSENSASDQILLLSLTSPQMQEEMKKQKPDAVPDIFINQFSSPDNFDLKNLILGNPLYLKDSISPKVIAGHNGYLAVFGGMVDQTSYFWPNRNSYFDATASFDSANIRLAAILSTFQFIK